ncbi:MAG: hypothetical protein CSA38_00705 [Flavobacteriales bacterium]|nr:MAG: hypothetical protein CSA38_00705 [Flavobacteriales bacterium]
MKKIKLIIILCLINFLNVTAQYGGNRVFNNSNKNDISRKTFYATDSTLTVYASILLNKEPKEYSMVIGIKSKGETIKEANKKGNDKIKEIIKRVEQLGIHKNDYYIDFISQTKMYDYNINEKKIKNQNIAELNEYLDSFCVRKNLIIKSKKLSQIDKIIDICAKQQIYDIVKIDYIRDDINLISKELFPQLMKIVQEKKNKFLKYSSKKLSGNFLIENEDLKVFYPKNLYNQYNEVYETSNIEWGRYYRDHIKKDIRKEKTLYYDNVESKYPTDIVIDHISPKIGIQYLMEVTVRYDLIK